jgi:hypothetical protein
MSTNHIPKTVSIALKTFQELTRGLLPAQKSLPNGEINFLQLS